MKKQRKLRLILGSPQTTQNDYNRHSDEWVHENDDKLVFNFDFDRRVVSVDTDYEFFYLEEAELCRLFDAMEMYLCETVKETE